MASSKPLRHPVRIIPARRYSVKPMTAEEAALD
jgi:hypothetical protein